MSGHAFELIPLTVVAKGEVLSSNIVEFRGMVRKALEAINREPKTDAEFGQAEADVKALKGAEDAVKGAKEKALSDAQQLHELFAALDDTNEEIRKARLELERVIKTKKEEVRGQLVASAIEAVEWDAPTSQRERMFGTEFEAAIKGKRTLDSMEKALATTAKAINTRLAKTRAILDEFEGEHGRELIIDRQGLEIKSADHVEAELRRRLDVKRAEDEKKKAQEEAAKAKAEAEEAKAKVAASDPAPTPPAPAPKPTAPALGDAPWDTTPSKVLATAEPEQSGPVSDEERREWEAFEAVLKNAFGPIREARAKLAHEANKDRAGRLAVAINTAWEAIRQEVA